MVWINDTPHSGRAKAEAEQVKQARAAMTPAQRRKNPLPKKPKPRPREVIIARLQRGDVLLMNGNRVWTWDNGDKIANQRAVHDMIVDGLLVGGGEALFPPDPGQLARSQTWRLAE